MSVFVKVCGLTNFDDALVASQAGADYLGFVLEPSSPRQFLALEELASIRAESGLPACAVFAGSLNVDQELGFDIVQAEEAVASKCEFWKAIRQASEHTADDLIRAAGTHSVVVIDTHHPILGGGTGQIGNWEVAGEFVSLFPGRVVLAGGLNPTNVAEAIRRVRPWAVDASSGLEQSPGQKDPVKVVEFVHQSKGG